MVVLFRAELVLREISFVSEIFFVGLHFLLNCNLIEGISRMTSFFKWMEYLSKLMIVGILGC